MKKEKLTVCFADLSNFARFSSEIGEEKAIDCLQEAYKKAGDSIARHEGKIVKYIGDAILFTFKDPVMAMRAAREITSQVRFEESGIVLQFHVSIATGDVFTGKAGHSSLVLEDVLGDTVNRAATALKDARIKQDRIAICDETLLILNL